MGKRNNFIFIMVFILFLISGCATSSTVVKTQSIPVGKVKISSSPSNANINVNDIFVGITPYDLPLDIKVETTHYPSTTGEKILGVVGIPFALIPIGSDCSDSVGKLLFGSDYDKKKGINYKVMVSKSGFDLITKTINSENPPKDLHFSLTGIIHKNIHITSTPPEAKVYTEDGKFLGNTPLSAEVPFKYKEGNLEDTRVLVKKDGYKTARREILMSDVEVDIHLLKDGIQE